MDEKDIKVIGNCIMLSNGNSHVFPFQIERCIIHRGLIFVLLQVPYREIFNENIFALDWRGNIVWQIEKLNHPTEDSPFTGIHIEKNGNLFINNWSGITYTVVPETGEILDSLLTK